MQTGRETRFQLPSQLGQCQKAHPALDQQVVVAAHIHRCVHGSAPYHDVKFMHCQLHQQVNKAALAADQSGLLWQRKRWGNEAVRHGFGHHINEANFKLAVPSDTCSQRILQLFADTAK